MTIVKGFSKPTIDLGGPAGNAFSLLGNAAMLGKQLNMSDGQLALIMTEMKSGDYYDLIEAFDKHFGHMVDLIIPDTMRDLDD